MVIGGAGVSFGGANEFFMSTYCAWFTLELIIASHVTGKSTHLDLAFKPNQVTSLHYAT
jgi:hypothetical protein